jgi:hypothetical protein
MMSRSGTSNWVISTFSGHEQIHVSRALMVCWVVIAGFEILSSYIGA